MTTVEHGQLLDDRYELQELIATGGMGEVWRGRDTRLGRDVAVKLLRSEYADDPTFLARFRREATHAAALSHPNIAAVHDYGETRTAATGEHVAYLVMELVDGDPLSARLSQGPLDTDTALEVLRQAAAGLAEAHRAGLVHRDVKPANILIRPDGRVKLTDFGIAASASGVPLTETGQLVGTPQYLAPERAMGEPAVPASDVYALGLVGYESLTGHPAFTGDNPVCVALKQVQEDPEPLPADLPPDVRHLIDAALTKDPEERIPDAGAFVAAIDETLDGPPTVSIGGGSDTRPVAAVRPPRRRPRRALVLAGLLLCVLAVGGVLLGTRLLGDGPSTPAGTPAGATAPSTTGGLVLAAADYIGRPADAVVAELTQVGLTVQRTDRVDPDHVPGTVTALSPDGTTVVPGDPVRVTVAVAPPATDDGAATVPSGEAVAPGSAGPSESDAPSAPSAAAGTGVPESGVGTAVSSDSAAPVSSAGTAGGSAPSSPADSAPPAQTATTGGATGDTTGGRTTDPGTTDGGSSPGTTDGGTTGTGTTDGGTTDGGTTDPGTTDTETTDTGTTDSGAPTSSPAETAPDSGTATSPSA